MNLLTDDGKHAATLTTGRVDKEGNTAKYEIEYNPKKQKEASG